MGAAPVMMATPGISLISCVLDVFRDHKRKSIQVPINCIIKSTISVNCHRIFMPIEFIDDTINETNGERNSTGICCNLFFLMLTADSYDAQKMVVFILLINVLLKTFFRL